MKIICPEKTYEQALIECGMELENRREKMCIKLINDMKRDVIQIKFYNFKCRTERFSNSLYSVCIRKYNIAIDNL